MTPETVILELSNPELQQSVRDAQLAYQSAQASFVNRQQEFQSALLNQQGDVAGLETSYKNAALNLEAQEKRYTDGLVSSIQLKQSRSAADELKNRMEIGQKRLAMQTGGLTSQRAPQVAEVSAEARRVRAASAAAGGLEDEGPDERGAAECAGRTRTDAPSVKSRSWTARSQAIR